MMLETLRKMSLKEQESYFSANLSMRGDKFFITVDTYLIYGDSLKKVRKQFFSVVTVVENTISTFIALHGWQYDFGRMYPWHLPGRNAGHTLENAYEHQISGKCWCI